MSVKRTRYEIEISVNPLRSLGEDLTPEDIQMTGVNGGLLFSPAKRVLRGEYDGALLAQFDMNERMRSFMAAVQRIPGEHVWVDATSGKMEWGTFDPLYEPKSPAMKRKAETITARMKDLFKQNIRFRKPSTRKIDDISDLKNVLYWMRRAVDSGKARVIGVELPSMEDIKSMPGRRDPWNGVQPSHDEVTAGHVNKFDYYVAPPESKESKTPAKS